MLAHLRPVKDPLLGAEAVTHLPARSRVTLVHVGGVLDPALADRARRAMAESARYRWVGELPRAAALATLAGSELLVVTSRLEGGPNAISEALAAGVPVLSTRIDGSVGLLGQDWPGLFPVGDARALAQLLARAEDDAGFRSELRAAARRLAPLVAPEREREAWRALLAEL
jgi:glycosyltransferase involved in cell wall biosynthesis